MAKEFKTIDQQIDILKKKGLIIDDEVMAKDILWFHSVIWPALLIGADISVHKKVYAHGFFTINGDKMSKSIGNVITPAQLVEKFGVDHKRYLAVSLIVTTIPALSTAPELLYPAATL